jgi:hypothetical protein
MVYPPKELRLAMDEILEEDLRHTRHYYDGFSRPKPRYFHHATVHVTVNKPIH